MPNSRPSTACCSAPGSAGARAKAPPGCRRPDDGKRGPCLPEPSCGPSGGFERLLEVLPEVLGVLASDADAQEIFGYAAFGGVACAAFERGLDGAEAGRVREDVHR